MSALRLVLFGDGAWAARSLDRLLAEGHEVASVVARRHPTDGALNEAAERNRLPVLAPERVNTHEFLARVASLRPDLCVSVSYDQIIQAPLREIAPRGFINAHAGKLPHYRGRSPINWALINGEPEIGITVHLMDGGIDTGDILVQRAVPVGWEDDYGDVLGRVVAAVPDLLADAVRSLADGTGRRRPQAHLTGSYYRRRGPGDEWLDWSAPAVEVYNKIRALAKPGPGAVTHLEGRRVVVWRASHDISWPAVHAPPGEILEGRSGRGVLVAAGDRGVFVDRVGIDGREEVPSFPLPSRFGPPLHTAVPPPGRIHRPLVPAHPGA